MPKLNISLAQMNIVLGNVNRNVGRMTKMVTEAARRGSHVVVLPELWSTGYALESAEELASTLNSGIFAQMSTVATQNKISLVGSVLENRGSENISNSAAFFSPNGRMLGVYRKIHLFRLMKEDQYLQQGSSPLVLDLPWGKTAFAICYDLRFPELFRRYALQEAIMTIISAEWPETRIAHWRALLIARAIENQCYIVATNSAGETGDTIFGGHSMVIDPWGKVLIEGGDEPNLLTVEIDLDRVAEARKFLPVFEDRRPDTYEVLDLGI